MRPNISRVKMEAMNIVIFDILLLEPLRCENRKASEAINITLLEPSAMVSMKYSEIIQAAKFRSFLGIDFVAPILGFLI